jgi:NADPH2:quinone reductase
VRHLVSYRETRLVRALLCKEFGPVSSLQIAEVPDPVAGDGEVLVRVEAAGLNYPDGLMVQGKYQVRPTLPFVPGMELAGVVESVGKGVDAFVPGDPVMATTVTGAFAERCAVPVEQVLPRPASLPADVAAASLLTCGTTLHALEDRARLQPGETLLVLGAAGGVGTAAVGLGKILGARVVAAASSPERLEVCRRLGADFTVDYAADDLRERVKVLTQGRGVDVVYDPVGGALSEAALRSTGWGGRFLVVGFASGEIPRIPLNLALLHARSILGVYWGDWSRREPRKSADALSRVAAWICERRLSPVVTARLGLAEVPGALEDLLSRRAHGKLVLLPGKP